ncbi:hypothetical protein [Pendulispora albinea]|uniref:Uncharacterized protein n=1 Tax=Pendulispora albinea TaxID=2741071 RepID=A0ABZ2M5B7_9BACT
MAEERKPKIDLKARLGKGSAGGGANPTAGAAIPVPVPQPDQAPPPVMPPPPMPGIPVGSPSPFAVDPSNPLAAVAAPYRPPAPPQPTRIEVDEATVQQARTGARKQGLLVAAVAAVVFLGVGYIAGQAAESGEGRNKSRKDASELASDVGAAKTKLQQLAEKLEAGRTALLKDRSYPSTLAKDLGGINIDFDGSKLAGRRFSGFPTDVTFQLVEFVTAVQALNDRKQLVQGLLTKLEKPLTDQLKAPPGQTTVNYVVVVDKDPGGNNSAILAPLTAPIQFTPPNLSLPGEFNFTNPLTGSASKLAAYKSGDVSRAPGAIYVVPKTFDKACPSETSGQTAQLAAQLANAIRDIRGEKGGPQDVVTDSKPGLLERADLLVTGLTQRVAK